MAITAPVNLMAWETNYVRIRTVQGEDQSRVISARIYQWGNEPLDMDGYTASVYIQERNGRKITEPAEISGNIITATIPYISSAGEACVQFFLEKPESEVLKIVGLILDVYKSDMEGAAEASDEYNHLVAATMDAKQAAELANGAAELATQIADDIQERAENGEFDGASGTIDGSTKTTLSGMLKGESGKVVAAAAGTDYLEGTDYSHLSAGDAVNDGSGTFSLTLDPPPFNLTNGMLLVVNFMSNISVNSKLNVNSLGAKPIVPYSGSHNINSGTHIVFFDGLQWKVLDSVYSGGTITGNLFVGGRGNFRESVTASSATINGILTTQDIVPDNNNSRNLGTDSKRYKSIKAFVGSFGEQITAPSGIFDNYLEVKGNEVWHPGNLKIATGESSIGDTGTGKSDTVTISLSSYGFVKRPVVFVNPNSTDLNTWAHVTQASATSFTVIGGRNSTNPGGFGFMWLAVQL